MITVIRKSGSFKTHRSQVAGFSWLAIDFKMVLLDFKGKVIEKKDCTEKNAEIAIASTLGFEHKTAHVVCKEEKALYVSQVSVLRSCISFSYYPIWIRGKWP